VLLSVTSKIRYQQKKYWKVIPGLTILRTTFLPVSYYIHLVQFSSVTADFHIFLKDQKDQLPCKITRPGISEH